MLFRLLFLIASMLALISPTGAQGLLTVTDANFEKLVSSSQLPIVVIVKADWCEKCRDTMPIIEDLQVEMKGQVRFAVLDADANQKTAAKLNVMNIPFIAIFRNGRQMSKQVGMINRSTLVEWINTSLGAH